MQKICCFNFLLSPKFYLHPCRLSDNPPKDKWQKKIIGAIVFTILSATIIFGISFWILARRQVRHLNKLQLSPTDDKVNNIFPFNDPRFTVDADGYVRFVSAVKQPAKALRPKTPATRQKVHTKEKSQIVDPEDLTNPKEKRNLINKNLEKVLANRGKKRKTYYVKVKPRENIDTTKKSFCYVNAELLQACKNRTKSVRSLLIAAKSRAHERVKLAIKDRPCSPP